ncbi:MAG: response regulator transcription factor [Gammaproteobacteria bacterium]|nr:response regulator transcription factor [Gammaproteobacteria bacterium]NND40056.1 response regulator transcription factor [Pseudomonadales bacterium]MBT8150053.1 response regulator transcription factor [Gammaproteobacteria bacterium]NNL11321.1 response regulator transcription factor [Pseudomonadales bacterium]NNM10932.1 response regulator transcription factor [Pseudomonadales bacterium]
MQVLLIEDDNSVANFIADGFLKRNDSVLRAADGNEGLKLAREKEFDVLIVDRMLPEVDGISIIEQLRGEDNVTPILVLSALVSVDERVEGLAVGADDYLTKPFDFDELFIRVQALHRRGQMNAPVTKLAVADLEIDLLSHEASRAGKKLSLQPREFRLLEFLMRHEGQVVTRTMLLENVWDYHFDPQTNVIDVHISRLRQKIDKGFDRQLLRTVRGSGYVLEAQ